MRRRIAHRKFSGKGVIGLKDAKAVKCMIYLKKTVKTQEFLAFMSQIPAYALSMRAQALCIF